MHPNSVALMSSPFLCLYATLLCLCSLNWSQAAVKKQMPHRLGLKPKVTTTQNNVCAYTKTKSEQTKSFVATMYSLVYLEPQRAKEGIPSQSQREYWTAAKMAEKAYFLGCCKMG